MHGARLQFWKSDRDYTRFDGKADRRQRIKLYKHKAVIAWFHEKISHFLNATVTILNINTDLLEGGIISTFSFSLFCYISMLFY